LISATLIAVVQTIARSCFTNAALEDALGTSRRTIEAHSYQTASLSRMVRNALEGASNNEFAALL
jgi:two-component system nitrogen regulation sensor histidine kinase GlnL